MAITLSHLTLFEGDSRFSWQNLARFIPGARRLGMRAALAAANDLLTSPGQRRRFGRHGP
jgi:hypothetical protein